MCYITSTVEGVQININRFMWGDGFLWPMLYIQIILDLLHETLFQNHWKPANCYLLTAAQLLNSVYSCTHFIKLKFQIHKLLGNSSLKYFINVFTVGHCTYHMFRRKFADSKGLCLVWYHRLCNVSMFASNKWADTRVACSFIEVV